MCGLEGDPWKDTEYTEAHTQQKHVFDEQIEIWIAKRNPRAPVGIEPTTPNPLDGVFFSSSYRAISPSTSWTLQKRVVDVHLILSEGDLDCVN